MQLNSNAAGIVYSHSPGVTMKAPESYLDERYREDLSANFHLAQGLPPAPFTWRGNMCINLSMLQRVAGHHKHSTGIDNVQLHGDGNQHASLGNLNAKNQ